MKRRFLKRVDIQASFICVILVVFSCLTMFGMNYKVTYDNTIKDLQSRTNAIYKTLDTLIEKDVYDLVSKKEDKDSKVYKDYQQRLLEMREVCNVRYLYTAKKNDEGKYIYLIDGLPLNSEDFRDPGDYIEEDIIPDIEMAYQGKQILPDEILDTTWGKIFLAYYPIHGQNNEVIGVVGIEMDAESQYASYNNSLQLMPIIISISCIGAFIIFTYCFRYISNPRRKDLYNIDGLTKLKNRASFESDLDNIYDKSRRISIIMLDLNYLKKMNDNYGHDAGDEYIKKTGETLSDVFKEVGVCYRIGGDEFVIILDVIDKNKIEDYIQQIHHLFELKTMGIVGEHSLSIGYAIFDEELDQTLNETLKRADHMMYENKRRIKEGRY